MGRHGLFTAERVAARHNISIETINHYARKGLLYPVELHDGVFFTSGDFIRLEVIAKGKRLGFSLNEIKRIMEGVRRPHHEPSPSVSG